MRNKQAGKIRKNKGEQEMKRAIPKELRRSLRKSLKKKGSVNILADILSVHRNTITDMKKTGFATPSKISALPNALSVLVIKLAA